MVKSIKLNDGNSAPWVAFGTGTVLGRTDVTSPASLALSRGFRHIDTAQAYQNEDTLGDAIAASGIPRTELYITTKLGNIPEGKTVEDTLRESLRKLKLDYVDLFLVHNPKAHVGRIKEVWKEVVEVKKKGLTKSIGVSNFNVKLINEVLSTGLEAPAANQIEYHPFVHANLVPLLELQSKHGIVTESYGGLTPILPTRAGDGSNENARERIAAALDKLAAARSTSKKRVTQNQILLKWLQHQGVIAVTTSTKESRLDEYLETESLPDFTDEEVKEFNASFEGVHFRSFKFFDYMEDQTP